HLPPPFPISSAYILDERHLHRLAPCPKIGLSVPIPANVNAPAVSERGGDPADAPRPRPVTPSAVLNARGCHAAAKIENWRAASVRDVLVDYGAVGALMPPSFA